MSAVSKPGLFCHVVRSLYVRKLPSRDPISNGNKVASVTDIGLTSKNKSTKAREVGVDRAVYPVVNRGTNRGFS